MLKINYRSTKDNHLLFDILSLIEFRHTMHQNPEIRWTEYGTQKRIMEYLLVKLKVDPSCI